mmetsp:Transcript_66921/g.188455  ORF Transcript_66921/g.188455 Transcript_66921/m.188455 type:complete len:166 (+) Transcript_66921:97-594(+)
MSDFKCLSLEGVGGDGTFDITVRIKAGDPPQYEQGVEERELKVTCAESSTWGEFWKVLCQEVGKPHERWEGYQPMRAHEYNQPELAPSIPNHMSGGAAQVCEVRKALGSAFELRVRALCPACRGTAGQGNFCCNACLRIDGRSVPGIYGTDPRTIKPAGWGCSPG